MMGEYHFTYEYAFWKFPASAALALLPAFRKRRGFVESGRSHEDRAATRAKRRMEARLRAKFKIIE